MNRKLLIEKLKKHLKNKDNIFLAFLFGSQAKNKTSPISDVDIAIWLKNRFSFEEVNEIWNEIEEIIEADVDLIVLNNSPPSISWTALRGIPLVIRDYDFYLEYMLRISCEAEDFQDYVLDLWKWREKTIESKR